MSDKKINESLVKAYNHMADSYHENRGLFDMTGVINDFYEALEIKKGSLLDCGCGAGEPFADWFIKRGWQVTGIDLSDKMLNLAKEYVPQMNRICAPMQEVDFEDNSFEAITAIYSLFHLPLEDQLLMFHKFFKWLKSKGSLLFTYATREYTHKDDFSGYMEFMGEKLYYSHRSPKELERELNDVGFLTESFKYRDIGGETFLWVTAIKR
jgi:ubiquinone/menaquinone biosynthesis C-methylase UbiE